MAAMTATEDAADLSLGKEFVGETCLSNAEVAVILAAEESKIKAEGRELNRCVWPAWWWWSWWRWWWWWWWWWYEQDRLVRTTGGSLSLSLSLFSGWCDSR